MKNLLVIFLFAVTSTWAQDSVELTVLFEEGSAIPAMPEMAMLNEIAQHPNSAQLRFSIVGHTDDLGSEEFNYRLSKERTKLVVNHLLLSGIKPYNILFSFKGEDCPAVENVDEISRAENRRVEVLISNIGSLDDPGFAGLYDEELFSKPLPRVVPVEEIFTIDNKKGRCLKTGRGTQVDIPPFAFMDAYGRPVGGEVMVTYQEIIDPFDVFLSGIDMRFENAEGTETLETAGMINLNATHKGRPVELRTDRPILVDLMTVSHDTDFDLQFLNPTNGSWEKIGTANMIEEDEALAEIVNNVPPAVSRYLEMTDYLSPAKASRITMEDRFQNMEYLDERPIASYFRFLRNGDEKEQKQFEKEWKRMASFEGKVLPVNENNNPNTVHFMVQKRSGFHKDLEYLPFNSHVWEYAGTASRTQVVQQLHEKRFNDIRVRFDEETQEVVLELKDLDGIIGIPVKKITVENMSVELKKRMYAEFAPRYQEARLRRSHRFFESKYEAYARFLNGKEEQIQKQADRFDQRSERIYKHELALAWKESSKQMTEAERMMSAENWMSYCEGISDRIQEYYAKKLGGNSVIRQLTLNRMGIYNCGRVAAVENPQHVEPRFVLSDGNAIEWERAYLFDKNVNSVISFDRSTTNGLQIDPGAVQMIIILDKKGNVYRLNETEVLAMNRGKMVQRILHMAELDRTAHSLDELREMLGLVTHTVR